MIVPDKIYIFKDIETENITKLINELKNTNPEIIYEESQNTIKIMKWQFLMQKSH